MLCALNGKSPWARYTSDADLITWTLADSQFTKPMPIGNAAGAMFYKIPNAVPGGPTHLINENTGTSFRLGTYDPQSESMNITSASQVIESGPVYTFAATGPATDGRLLTLGWVRPQNCVHKMRCANSVLSLVRELYYDGDAHQLASRPVAEYNALRNATFVAPGTSMTLLPGTTKSLPIPPESGGAIDMKTTFRIPNSTAVSGFGIAVRDSNAGPTDDPDFALTFNVSTANAQRIRTIHTEVNYLVSTCDSAIRFFLAVSYVVRFLAYVCVTNTISTASYLRLHRPRQLT
jgi:hypothetical protein